MPRWMCFVVVAAVLSLPATVAYGQCLVDGPSRMTASDGANGDKFGSAVAMSGDVVVVGAQLDDDACPGNEFCQSGAAYVYRFDGTNWIEEAKLTASDVQWSAGFGRSAAVDGDVIVVAAPLDSTPACTTGIPEQGFCFHGSAYVFRFDGANWIEEAKLVASDAANGDRFGEGFGGVSVSGNVILVGAFRNEDTGNATGSAYVFRFDGTNWSEEAKLLASDAAAINLFGNSVSVVGDLAVIGAPFPLDASQPTRGPGAAYVFRFDGINWIEEVKLTASDGANNDEFGSSVSLSGDMILIGARSDDDAAGCFGQFCNSGSAYVFRFDGANWIEEAKLTAADGAQADQFGGTVSLDGDAAVIGAWFDDGTVGSAYVFRFDGTDWTEESKLTATDGTVGDFFGVSISINSGQAVIGVSRPENSIRVGSAYVFGGLSDCNANAALDLCETAGGTSPDNNANGIPDICEDAPGDMDCDVVVDPIDIPLFVQALIDPAGFAGCDIGRGDMNGDTLINGADVQLFVQALMFVPPPSPTTGACCLADETCVDESQPGICVSTLGGQFQGIGTTCATVTCPAAGACCLLNGTCIQAVQFVCSGLGGSFSGEGVLCSDITCTACVTCPPGSIPEGEPWCILPDTTNPGCGSNPPIFQPITCGTTICGAAWQDNNSSDAVRDKDNYELILTETSEITWSVEAEFPFNIRISDGIAGCVGLPPVDSLLGAACQTASVTATLPPGTYWLAVEPEFFQGPDCGHGPFKYAATVTCVALPTGACCLPNGTCIEVVSSICTSNGGTFSGDGTLCSEITCTSCVTCPPGSIPEGEPWCDAPDTTNGGCNSTPEVFQAITCGTTVCGTGWAEGGSRDTDWYELVVTQTQDVTWTVEAEFPPLIAIINGNAGCAGLTIPAIDSGLQCQSVAVTATLAPGTYWLFVGPENFEGVECVAGPREYSATLTCVP